MKNPAEAGLVGREQGRRYRKIAIATSTSTRSKWNDVLRGDPVEQSD